jgi:hypothetical protein
MSYANVRGYIYTYINGSLVKQAAMQSYAGTGYSTFVNTWMGSYTAGTRVYISYATIYGTGSDAGPDILIENLT